MNIAFIGLGRMGWHMAAHLARAGHTLAVYDVSSPLPQDWVKAFGGRAGSSVADAVTGAELVLSSLPADAALQAVWDQAQPALIKTAIWIDHSTTSAEIARRLAKAAKAQGGHFIDAPVSGGTVGAEKGTLAVMAGADDETAWAKVEPVMSAYAQRASNLCCRDWTSIGRRSCIRRTQWPRPQKGTRGDAQGILYFMDDGKSCTNND